MDVFHIIVMIVASVLLILILTSMSILLKNDKHSQKFPTSHSVAPDGWALSDDVDANNVVTGKTLTSTDGTNPAGIDVVPKTFTLTEWDDICIKKLWADKANVYWDGITTYNGC
jgi:hypothetical protein